MYLDANPPFSKCFYLKILFCDVYWLFSNSVVLFVLVLIETIRNYRKAYPNGAKMLKTEIMELLNELMDLDYKENQEDDQENDQENED